MEEMLIETKRHFVFLTYQMGKDSRIGEDVGT